jgi:hypothetical protein
MKLKTTSRIGAAVVAAIALTSAAHAAFITGQINMGTDGTVAGSGVVYQDSAGVTTTNLALAAGVKSWVAPVVSSTSGAFTSITNGTAVTFATPWIFDPSTAYTPLWTVGNFTFDLSSSVFSKPVIGGKTFLVVAGTGVIKNSVDGYDDTPGSWEFSSQGKAAGGVFSWSSSTTSVPDGGTTIALLGFSLLGLHGVRRKFAKA